MLSRRRSYYLPHLSRSHRDNVAAWLVSRGYRAETRGDSVFTDAASDVVALAQESTFNPFTAK